MLHLHIQNQTGTLAGIWAGIKNVFNAALDGISNAIGATWAWIQQTFANNPILNIIFPIIGIARLIINNWGVIAPFFQELWAKVVNYVVSRIVMLANSINTYWTLIKSVTIAAWNAVKTAVQNHAIAVLTVVLRVWNTIYTSTMAIWNPIKAWLLSVWNSIKTAITTAATAILMFIINTWTRIYGTTVATWANIKAAVIAAWNALINWVRSTSAYQAIVNQWNSITSYLSGLKDTLFNLGARIIGGLIDGIASKFGALKSKWNTVASVINGSYKGTATVNSVASTGAAMAGFSSGGYTGDGGRNAVAGIVHRGEGVLNQNEIRRIGGESGFNRLRQWIQNGGMSLLNSGRSALAATGIGADSALLNKGMELLSGKTKAQPKMKFAEAISFGAAMQNAGSGGAAVAGGGDFNITIHINGAQNPTDVAAEVRRQLEQFMAKMRPSKSNFKDRD